MWVFGCLFKYGIDMWVWLCFYVYRVCIHPNTLINAPLRTHTSISTLESCGARFLAPRTGIAPLSFAPTRTGPKNSKFYGPDPGPTRLYFPRTGPDRNSLASTRNLKVSTRTDPKNSEVWKIFCVEIKEIKSSFRLQ